MFHQETQDGEHIEGLIIEALREILAHQDAERYLPWALVRIPEVLGLSDTDLTSAEILRVATLLAVAIWRATPMPSADFRTRPLFLDDDVDCPCGSEVAFGACCGRSDELPDLSSDVIWELLLGELSERQIRRALSLGAVPDRLKGKVAERWLELDRPGRAIALLEPLIEVASADSQAAVGSRDLALEILCDAYDRLEHRNKKRAFLARMTKLADRTLRGAAWRRLSAGYLDEGDFTSAHEAFVQALRQSPNDPSLAFLEIALLIAQHRDDEASRRASFWHYRLARLGLGDEDVLAFLSAAQQSPQQALLTSQAPVLDPSLLRLHEWLQAVERRPLPRYRLASLPSRDASMADNQLHLFQLDELTAPARVYGITAAAAKLRPSAALRRLESLWHNLFPAGKPHSTQLTLAEEADLWDDADWVDFLVSHPEAGDSLDILDDLATAIYTHPESTFPWVTRALISPILARARAILEVAVPEDSAWSIPWSWGTNRPALRLVFREYLYQLEARNSYRATAILEELLRFNPRDNHGARADLMNHYLRDRRDDKALALARRFPDDRLVELAYGEVLALYRLGQPERAERALSRAIGRLPRIPAYLTRQRIKPPKRTPWRMPPSSEDQAWLYREAMRDVWVAEPGVLAWLKRMTA